MAARKFVFGKPPFRFLVDHLVQEADFLDDAQQILNLDETPCTQLAAILAKSDSFLSRSELRAITGDTLGEGSERIASIIYQMGMIIHDADMDPLEAMERLAESIRAKAERLQPEQQESLIDRIRQLVAEPIGIAKQYKARQLVDATGGELNEFRMICDIRPIFDPERKQIEGAIPLSILRLEYTKPDGESDVVEVRVTEKQIVELQKKLADAQLKLTMIKQLLANQHLSIPRTKSTVSEDES